MARINDGEVEERGWVHRHQYSNVEEPTNLPPPPLDPTPSHPPMPPLGPTPSPGNPAAFAAGVGLYAYELFNSGPPANSANFSDFNAANFDGISAANFGDPHDGDTVVPWAPFFWG